MTSIRLAPLMTIAALLALPLAPSAAALQLPNEVFAGEDSVDVSLLPPGSIVGVGEARGNGTCDLTGVSYHIRIPADGVGRSAKLELGEDCRLVLVSTTILTEALFTPAGHETGICHGEKITYGQMSKTFANGDEAYRITMQQQLRHRYDCPSASGQRTAEASYTSASCLSKEWSENGGYKRNSRFKHDTCSAAWHSYGGCSPSVGACVSAMATSDWVDRKYGSYNSWTWKNDMRGYANGDSFCGHQSTGYEPVGTTTHNCYQARNNGGGSPQPSSEYCAPPEPSDTQAKQ